MVRRRTPSFAIHGRRGSSSWKNRTRTVILLVGLAASFAWLFLYYEVFYHTPIPSSDRNAAFYNDVQPQQKKKKRKRSSSRQAPPPSSNGNAASLLVLPNKTCLFSAWQPHLPALITSDENPKLRRRYQTLPRITTTDPLPYSNIILRSSFKAGFSYMNGIVKALYAGNETRQSWLNATRKKYPRRIYPPHSWRSVAFIRDPIDRFQSMYSQMQTFTNRKYHWYGEHDAEWIDIPEGRNRASVFVSTVQRRFYNDHLLPQLYFLADSTNVPPNLTFVGRLERLVDDWEVMVDKLGGFPADVVRDARELLLQDVTATDNNKEVSSHATKIPAHSRNKNKNIKAKVAIQRILTYNNTGDDDSQQAVWTATNANNETAMLLKVCDMYRPDFACFGNWLETPRVCEEAWRREDFNDRKTFQQVVRRH